MSERRISQSVRAYARGAQIAVWLQVFVAVVALGVSIWFSKQISDQQQTLTHQRDQISSNVAILQNVQSAATALLNASMQPEQLGFATTQIQEADQRLAALAAEGEDAERRDELRRLLLRTLANAQSQAGDTQAAIGTITELRTLHEPDANQQLFDTVTLATYQCKAGNADAARALVGGDFATRNTTVLVGSDAFQRDCSALAAELIPAAAPPTDSEIVAAAPPEDSEYKIHLVYLQVQSAADRARASEIAQALCQAHYSAPGIEVVAPPRAYPRRAEIRYYYLQQEAEAQHIASVVREAGGPEIVPRLLSGLDGLPTDRLEIWLAPSGSDATAAPDSNSGNRRAQPACSAQ